MYCEFTFVNIFGYVGSNSFCRKWLIHLHPCTDVYILYFSKYTDELLKNLLKKKNNKTYFSVFSLFKTKKSRIPLLFVLFVNSHVLHTYSQFTCWITEFYKYLSCFNFFDRHNKRNKFYIDQRCHPQTIAVVETRARYSLIAFGSLWQMFYVYFYNQVWFSLISTNFCCLSAFFFSLLIFPVQLLHHCL